MCALVHTCVCARKSLEDRQSLCFPFPRRTYGLCLCSSIPSVYTTQWQPRKTSFKVSTEVPFEGEAWKSISGGNKFAFLGSRLWTPQTKMIWVCFCRKKKWYSWIQFKEKKNNESFEALLLESLFIVCKEQCEVPWDPALGG